MKPTIHTRLNFYSWLTYGTLLLCIGCTGQRTPDGMPPLYPCTLYLTMEGNPLDGASVTLHPIETGVSAYSAGGTTNAGGIVEIVTSGQYKGAPLGKYKVTVTKTELVFKPGFEPDNIKITPSGDAVQDRKNRFAIAQDHARTVALVAPDFQKKDTTPLEVEVKAGKNRFEFVVNSPTAGKEK